MRKITALALCVLMVLSAFAFTSCAKEPTAYELVYEAMEKMSALDSLELEQKMDMKMDMMGMTMDVPMSVKIKGKHIKSDSPILRADMTTTMMETSVDSVVYIESGYVFLTSLSDSYKMKLADVEQEYNVLEDLTSVFRCPAESVFEGVEIIKNDDGTRTVSLALTQEDYFAAYGDHSATLLGELGLEGNASFTDIKIDITVNKEGYLCGFKMSCGIAVTVTEMGMDIPVTATVAIDSKYYNFGANVTITPPEGYQDFEELSLN